MWRCVAGRAPSCVSDYVGRYGRNVTAAGHGNGQSLASLEVDVKVDRLLRCTVLRGARRLQRVGRLRVDMVSILARLPSCLVSAVHLAWLLLPPLPWRPCAAGHLAVPQPCRALRAASVVNERHALPSVLRLLIYTKANLACKARGFRPDFADSGCRQLEAVARLPPGLAGGQLAGGTQAARRAAAWHAAAVPIVAW